MTAPPRLSLSPAEQETLSALLSAEAWDLALRWGIARSTLERAAKGEEMLGVVVEAIRGRLKGEGG